MYLKNMDRARTSDFGIEMVKKVVGNLQEMLNERNKRRILITRNESEAHVKNLAVWTHFLSDVAEGKTDSTVAGDGAELNDHGK